jgi:ribonuclease Z
VVQCRGRVLLFDCGEGTQFQIHQAGIRRSRLDAVFISHVHGDHIFGLPGLLSSLGLDGHTDPVHIFGPPGTAGLVNTLVRIGAFVPTFDIEIKELSPTPVPETVFTGSGYRVDAAALDHRVPAVGYRFREDDRPGHLDVERATALGVVDPRLYGVLKSGESVTVGAGYTVYPDDVVGPTRPGGTFAYCFDTRPCPGATSLSENVDLLYHDATFATEHQDKAIKTGHSTAAEAAKTALEAQAHHLLLGHFSGRYVDLHILVEEAREVFPHTEAAVELTVYPLRDTGGPDGDTQSTV